LNPIANNGSFRGFARASTTIWGVASAITRPACAAAITEPTEPAAPLPHSAARLGDRQVPMGAIQDWGARCTTKPGRGKRIQWVPPTAAGLGAGKDGQRFGGIIQNCPLHKSLPNCRIIGGMTRSTLRTSRTSTFKPLMAGREAVLHNFRSVRLATSTLPEVAVTSSA